MTEGSAGSDACSALLRTPETAAQAAVQLARIAAHFGFEGWLINVENDLSVDQVQILLAFLRCASRPFRGQRSSRPLAAHRRGTRGRCTLFAALCHRPSSRACVPPTPFVRRKLRAELAARVRHPFLVWYDAVTAQGDLYWQNTVNSLNRRVVRRDEGRGEGGVASGERACGQEMNRRRGGEAHRASRQRSRLGGRPALRCQTASLSLGSRPFFDACDAIFVNYTWKSHTPRQARSEVRYLGAAAARRSSSERRTAPVFPARTDPSSPFLPLRRPESGTPTSSWASTSSAEGRLEAAGSARGWPSRLPPTKVRSRDGKEGSRPFRATGGEGGGDDRFCVAGGRRPSR